jgi:Predicted membrane protein (DUF2306)
MRSTAKMLLYFFSLTFTAVMLRLYIPASFIAGADFAIAYSVIAWLCWLPNFLVAEWMIKTARRNSTHIISR